MLTHTHNCYFHRSWDTHTMATHIAVDTHNCDTHCSWHTQLRHLLQLTHLQLLLSSQLTHTHNGNLYRCWRKHTHTTVTLISVDTHTQWQIILLLTLTHTTVTFIAADTHTHTQWHFILLLTQLHNCSSYCNLNTHTHIFGVIYSWQITIVILLQLNTHTHTQTISVGMWHIHKSYFCLWLTHNCDLNRSWDKHTHTHNGNSFCRWHTVIIAAQNTQLQFIVVDTQLWLLFQLNTQTTTIYYCCIHTHKHNYNFTQDDKTQTHSRGLYSRWRKICYFYRSWQTSYKFMLLWLKLQLILTCKAVLTSTNTIVIIFTSKWLDYENDWHHFKIVCFCRV